MSLWLLPPHPFVLELLQPQDTNRSIHPKQIEQLNKVFTPSEEEIAYAKKVIKAFNNASDGLVVVDGKLIEKPVLRTALKTIANSN